jgi:hypothetical protein
MLKGTAGCFARKDRGIIEGMNGLAIRKFDRERYRLFGGASSPSGEMCKVVPLYG